MQALSVSPTQAQPSTFELLAKKTQTSHLNVTYLSKHQVIDAEETPCIKDTAMSVLLEGKKAYVHANLVTLSTFKAIAAKFPQTLEAKERFWKMALDHTDCLISLHHHDEDSGMLYPLAGEGFIFRSMKVAGVSRKCLNAELEIDHAIYQIKDGQYVKNISALHLMCWPDQKSLNVERLSALIDLLSLETLKAPPLIHCKAGLGRTGSFIVACELKRIKSSGRNPMDDDLDRAILEGRAARGEKFVQTEEQYQMLQKYLLSLQTSSKILRQTIVSCDYAKGKLVKSRQEAEKLLNAATTPYGTYAYWSSASYAGKFGFWQKLPGGIHPRLANGLEEIQRHIFAFTTSSEEALTLLKRESFQRAVLWFSGEDLMFAMKVGKKEFVTLQLDLEEEIDLQIESFVKRFLKKN